MRLYPWSGSRNPRRLPTSPLESVSDECPCSIVTRQSFLGRGVRFSNTPRDTILSTYSYGLPATPIYVGAAKGRNRIYNHAKKDNGNAKLARKADHINFAEYIEERAENGPGWLRITLRPHRNPREAEKEEKVLIAKWGTRTRGGILFNRSLSG